MTCIPLALYMLLAPRKSSLASWALCTGMMLFPRNLLSSAGYITTSLSYVWPAALGLFALLPLKQAYEGKKHAPKPAVAAAVLMLLFAASSEQMCAVLLELQLCLLIARLFMDRAAPPPISLLYLLVTLASLCFTAVCPGNQARYASELSYWFPDFDALSLFTKLEMGFSSAGFYLLIPCDLNYAYTPFNYIFLYFCVILAAASYNRAVNTLDRWASLIPVSASLFLGPFSAALFAYFPHLTNLGKALTQTGTNPSLLSPSSLMPDALLLLVFACVMYDLWHSFDEKPTALLTILIVLAGIASRFVMAFSPTIWGSGERTCTFMYIALIAAVPLLLNALEAPEHNRRAPAFIRQGIPLTFLLFMLERFAG